MTKLVIHQPKNFESRYYRYYNILFDKIIDKLKLNYDVIDSRYFKYANSQYFPLVLLHQDTSFSNTNIHMLECEMVIENYDTHHIKVLSMADDFTGTILNLQNSELLDTVLIGQFNQNKINHHIYDIKNRTKYLPWIYFPQNDLDYNFYYNYRQSITTFIDKFYFRGTSLEHRKILSYFDNKYFVGGGPIGGFDNYAKDLLQYKIGFSIAGRGQFCYRDIEYMAMGIPFLRFEYSNAMNPNLIPNYHYISVPRPQTPDEEFLYSEEHAKLIENKFLEIKDDTEFLKFIASNAKSYYDNYIQIDNAANHTIDLLNIKEWHNET